MSIERAEKLKELLTDKFVVVDAGVPELKRFQNWTGKVRTVNMNCRALVEFDGPVDIGWYDIDPDYLKVVDGPIKKAPAPAAKAAPAESKPAATAPKTATVGKSPLDAIRAQQAAKGTAAPAAASAPGAKPSPMDMIRKQQAAKAAAAGSAPASEIAAATPVVEAAPVVAEVPPIPTPVAETAAPTPLPITGPDGKPLSKLDLIRMQGAKKK